MLKQLKWIVFPAAALALLPPQVGFSADFYSPRMAGLAGSGRAGPLLNDAIYLNPSFTSFLPTYSLSGNQLTYSGDADPALGPGSRQGRNVSFSIVDGRNPLFQAGVAYTRREDGTMVHVGASKALLQRLGLGIGGKFFLKGSGKPTGQELVVSTTAVPVEWFQVAAVVDNALDSEASRARGLRREFILGTKFNLDRIVLVYFDPQYAPARPGSQRYGFSAGLEFVLMADLFLRTGMFRNTVIPHAMNTVGRGYGVGLGWVGPRMSLDYGLSRTVDPRSLTAHSMGVSIYF